MQSLANIADHPDALATLLSIGFAIMLGTFGFIWNSIQEKKRYTFEVLMKYTENTAVLVALHRVWKHISSNKTYSSDRIDDDLEQHLALLLSYFQSIAVAANHHMLNERILLIARYGSMKTIWDFFYPYVERKRRDLGRPLLYVDLEDFLRENAVRYRHYQKRYGVRHSGQEPASTVTRDPALEERR